MMVGEWMTIKDTGGELFLASANRKYFMWVSTRTGTNRFGDKSDRDWEIIQDNLPEGWEPKPLGINFDENDVRMLWFTKDNFLNYLKCEDCIFNHQQGGKSIENDDYICTKVDKLLELSFIKTMDQW